MNDSTVKICPVCNKEILEGEAIAVCEKCGKTYHAECYANGCTNEECKGAKTPEEAPAVTENAAAGTNTVTNTVTNTAATTPAATVANAAPAATITCSKCGAQLAVGQRFCSSCGHDTTVRYEAHAANAPKKSKGPVIGILAAIAVVLAIVLFVIFRPIAVESIVMEEKAVELVESDMMMLEYRVYPEKATIKNVEWTSSDSNVAEVSGVGRLDALNPGECTITLVIDGVKAEVEVVVKKDLPNFDGLYDDYCNSSWAEVGSDKSYLEIDTNPYDIDDYYGSDAVSAIEKLNAAMGLPDSVYRDMMNTTWSMGKQSETFEDVGIKVEWTYHPDKGLEVTYKHIKG